MTEELYRRISAPFRTEARARALRLVNETLTALGYVAYPVLLIALALT